MSEDRSTMNPAGSVAFSAADLRWRKAEREAAKELRHMQEQEEKQKAVVAEFYEPAKGQPNSCFNSSCS